MRKINTLGCAIILLSAGFVWAGAQAEANLQEVIQIFTSMANSIEKAKTIAEIKPMLEKHVERIGIIQKDLESNKPSPEEEKKLKSKYDLELQKAVGRFGVAVEGMKLRDANAMKDLELLFTKGKK